MTINRNGETFYQEFSKGIPTPWSPPETL
jgi:hypothetical protein